MIYNKNKRNEKMDIIRNGRQVGTGRHGRHVSGSTHPRSKKWDVWVLTDFEKKEYTFDRVYNSLGEIANHFGIAYAGIAQMRLRWKREGDSVCPLLRIKEAE
jgi:hypothetical protein